MSRDLFDERSFEEEGMRRMTFGEHLEDLRRRLIFALLSFIPGLLLALFIGGAIVSFMKQPAQRALEQYHRERTADRRKQFQESLARNEPQPVETIRLRISRSAFQSTLEDLYPQLKSIAATSGSAPAAGTDLPVPGVPNGRESAPAAATGTSVASRAPSTAPVSATSMAQPATKSESTNARTDPPSKLDTNPKQPRDVTGTPPGPSGVPPSVQAASPADTSKPEAIVSPTETPIGQPTSAAEPTWVERLLKLVGLKADTLAVAPRTERTAFARPDDAQIEIVCDLLRQELELAATTSSTDDAIVSLNPQETLMAYLKASMIAGLVISCPFVFYHVWAFIAEGLYSRERQAVYRSLPTAILLFLTGTLFCFFLVLPFVLDFLLSFNRWIGIKPQLRLADWLGFATLLPVLFGVSFELPIVMVLLERIGVFRVSDYREKRRHAILAIAVFSMIITPTTDPGTMLLLMVPMMLLYECGIWFVRWRSTGDSPSE